MEKYLDHHKDTDFVYFYTYDNDLKISEKMYHRSIFLLKIYPNTKNQVYEQFCKQFPEYLLQWKDNKLVNQ